VNCGECTLCCTLLPVDWMDSPAGETCQYCDNGCTIQDTKDDRCREFQCAYSQMEQVNIALRPDKCGVIFEKLDGDLVFGTVDPDRDEYPHIMGQVNNFNRSGANVVLVKNGITSVYPLDGVSNESVLARIK